MVASFPHTSALHGVDRRPRRTLAKGAEPFCPLWTARVLVVSTPAPHRDDRKHEATAFADQFLFIDFENAVRGPVEYDLAWVPEEVSERYPDADQELVGECRGLMLAIIAAWRWRRDDQHPSGRRSGMEFLNAFRQGPPWPTVDTV